MTIIDDTERVLEVIVEDSQLSLAIGKKGQNVRLAAKLTNWKIDIKSEGDKRREVEAQFDGFDDEDEAAILKLPGLDDTQLVKLTEAGLDTADRLLDTSAAKLAEVAGIDEAAALELQVEIRKQVVAAEEAAAAQRAEASTDSTDTDESSGDAVVSATNSKDKTAHEDTT